MFASDYRQAAWEKLRGNWTPVVVSFLLYSLLISALSTTGLGSLLLGGPLTVAFVGVVLTLVRTGSTKIETMFDGFTDGFVSRMLGFILYTLYIALWSILFIIPGIVKSYSYAMTFYILRDDPSIGANEAITRSRQMMDGHKWQLFCLHFSFIGWILLSMLTLGILTLWVMPYMETATAVFYESIKGEGEAQKTEPAEGDSNGNGTTEFI